RGYGPERWAFPGSAPSVRRVASPRGDIDAARVSRRNARTGPAWRGGLRIAFHGAAAGPRAGGIRGAGADAPWYPAPGRRGRRGEGWGATPAAGVRPPAP